ncbi:hypothetical protein EII14_02305 [Alloprevotella sp. OH1205_COT-284]|uniref:DUF6048 family protein n=1 Tax=Alloprevotella sp. OH1205_COT-284 TaxID=2491043 RepID=UPI000F5F55C5|nr:DUF6048 family protein [Alloprevotella sp. OH1205_COT-284]RRD80470.1 hypothetical protein EII14_02305 [Alloprevotella sp. OH1205_COT-284]
MLKILKFIFTLLCSSFGGMLVAMGQTPTDTTNSADVQGIRFVDKAAEKLALAYKNRSVPFWGGLSVSIDLAGAAMANATAWGQYEGMLRLNLRNTYFPLIEAGQGRADHTGETSGLHFVTRSPYLRVGMDYNLKKDRSSKNRVFVGARYGFSSFRYDLNGPDIIDVHWKNTVPFHFEALNGNAHWGELTFGLESQIWKFVHLGWSVRYRRRIYEKRSPTGRTWYIPGYGRNSSSSTLGGTFNLIFDLTHFKHKP